MVRIKRLSRLVMVLAMLIAIAITRPVRAEAQRLESDVKTSAASVIGSWLKRLPEIWKIKREANQIASTLPVFQGAISLPDSETIFTWIRELCATPHRRPGTSEGHQAESWVADRFREIGVEQVTLDPIPMTVWTAQRWSLQVAGQEIPSFYVVNTGFTGPQGLSAPLVYVGVGQAKDFEGKDLAGKIVVAEVPFPKIPYGSLFRLTGAAYFISDPDHSITMSSSQYLNFVRQNFVGGTTAETAPPEDVYWQSVRQGAAGICLILRDQPSNSNTHYGPYDGIMKPLPGLWVGKSDGIKLREAAQAGSSATLVLEGKMEPGVMHNVWGVLPGRSEEVILVTSHSDSPFTGAVEDGAGAAQVLAQAWTWSRVPKEQRPKTLVFVVDSGHFYGSLGAHSFARTHQEIMKRTRILITLEHLAGKEVEERNGEYAETGRPALTVMFTTHDPKVIASVIKALRTKPAKATAAIPSNFFASAPTSDAAGYVIEAGVPVISWIGCPYYLLDAHDTLDKIQPSELNSIAGTVAEMVGIYMVMPDK